MLPPPDQLLAAAGRSRAFAAVWRASSAWRQAQAALDAAATGGAEAVARAAERLLCDDAWLAGLLGGPISALAADPWAEPPLRANRDPLRSGAILFEHAAATLTASVLSAAVLRTLPAPATVVVPGRLTVTRYVRAGGARLERWRAPALRPCFTAAAMGRAVAAGAQRLRDGRVIRHDGRRDAQLLSDAACDVVTLTATVRLDAASVMREYDRATGAFVRMATTDEGAARSQLLLTLLRESGAEDAGPCFEAATRDGAFFLRWSAMREWLAHDWRGAWTRLREMARDDPHPEVRATARATLDTLTARRAA